MVVSNSSHRVVVAARPMQRPRRVVLLVACGLLAGAAAARLSAAAHADTQSPKGGISAKIVRYAGRLVHKYDQDGSRRLEQHEWQQMGGDPRRADGDGDAVVTLEELARHVASYSLRRKIRLRSPGPEVLFVFPLLQSPDETVSLSQQDTVPAEPPVRSRKPPPRYHVSSDRLPDGLPGWFGAHDANGDGQISMAEFSQQVPRSDQQLFARCDANADGIVTARECARAFKAITKVQDAAAKAAEQAPAQSGDQKAAEATASP